MKLQEEFEFSFRTGEGGERQTMDLPEGSALYELKAAYGRDEEESENETVC
jgi:hypothetical protein